MIGLGGLKRRAPHVAVALTALISTACADTPQESTTAPEVLPSAIASGTPGALVPVEPQPAFRPCGAEHPQPGALIRYDSVADRVAWKVAVPVQVTAMVAAEGRVHLSDGVGLDIAVDQATGRLTFPAAEADRLTPYTAALPDGRGFDDETAAAMASIDLGFDLGHVVDATRVDADLLVLAVFPGSECA